MAGGPADLLDEEQGRVAVAVEPDGLDFLDVARAFALAPQGAARAAVVVGFARVQGFLPSLAVNPGQHEDFPRGGVLSHGGDQPAALLEIGHEGERAFRDVDGPAHFRQPPAFSVSASLSLLAGAISTSGSRSSRGMRPSMAAAVFTGMGFVSMNMARCRGRRR